MKLGLFFSFVYNALTFEQALNFAQSIGAEAVELGTGNYAGKRFVDLDELLADESKRKAFARAIESRGLFISSFSTHGNPLSPNKIVAREHHETIIKTIDLAHMMGVPIVNSFSGQPGAPDGTTFPNFPPTSWPPVYPELFKWQWEYIIIPYWKEVGRYAASKQVKLAIEPHQGFAVHSPATLLKLRDAVGDVLGASFDASHMWPEGIDPVAAIKILGYAGAIFNVSTKDMQFLEPNLNFKGVLDVQPADRVRTRSWIYRTIGYGHGTKEWADIISALQMTGYSYVFSIEQDDPIIDGLEGATKAARLLRDWLIRIPYHEEIPLSPFD
jgi:sugar phosphate isomerase/epimerase